MTDEAAFLLYSELCVQIWVGSPVSTIMSSGILPYHLVLMFLFGCVRCSVDGRSNRNRRGVFSKFSGIVWTKPESFIRRLLAKISVSVCNRETKLDLSIVFRLW